MSKKKKKKFMLKIDQEKCIGCGLCESLCPACFKLNTEIAKAEVIDAEENCGCDLEQTISSCPTGAISKE